MQYNEPPKPPARICQVINFIDSEWPPKSECEASIVRKDPLYITLPNCISEVGDQYLKNRRDLGSVASGTANTTVSGLIGSEASSTTTTTTT